DSETRINQQKPFAFKRREKIQRLNLLAAAGGQRRERLEKKWNIRAELRGEAVQIRHCIAEELVQRSQRDGRIGAAAAQPRRKRKVLLQVNPNAVLSFCVAEKQFRRAINQIPGVGGQFRNVASQLNGTAAAREGEFVVKRHGMHDGFQFVE